MPSSDTTSVTSTSMAGRSKKRSKTIILRLPSSLLNRWPGTSTTTTTTTTNSDENPEEKMKKASASPSSSSPPDGPSSSVDVQSETVTPAAAPAEPTNPSPEVPRRKGIPGPKPGSKRSAPTDAIPKPRGKPGPKKKPRLEDGTIDHSASAARPSLGSTANKLGPKANQGAINAGLRALDRTGKPPRKWHRKAFNVKSFTGVLWEVPAWSAPPKPKPAEDGADATKTDEASLANGEPDNKESNHASDKSNTGDGDSTPLALNGITTPTPPVAAAS